MESNSGGRRRSEGGKETGTHETALFLKTHDHRRDTVKKEHIETARRQ